jgi:hypothetical protein
MERHLERRFGLARRGGGGWRRRRERAPAGWAEARALLHRRATGWASIAHACSEISRRFLFVKIIEDRLIEGKRGCRVLGARVPRAPARVRANLVFALRRVNQSCF